jgi:hypothetical protein
VLANHRYERNDGTSAEFEAVGIDPDMLAFGAQGPTDGVYTLRANAA